MKKKPAKKAKKKVKRPVGRPRKKKVAKKAVGRPLVEVDENAVVALASVGCTAEEIAAYVGCGRRVMFDRFSHLLEKGHNQQKVSIRRQQHKLMMAGDRTMAIWLGKQHCSQFEPHRVTTMGEGQPRVAGQTADQFESETIRLIFAEIEKRQISRKG